MHKFCGNDIIYSNSHIYTMKIVKQKSWEESFYRLRINFFRHCPLISTSTDTESYILTEIFWLIHIFNIPVPDIKIFDGFIIKQTNIQTMANLTFLE